MLNVLFSVRGTLVNVHMYIFMLQVSFTSLLPGRGIMVGNDNMLL